MHQAEKIKTIDAFKESKYKERGSLFIGQAYPLLDEEDAAKIITKVKNEYFDAAHHCYAYRYSPSLLRFTDDGEPQGTAGLRILQAIDHFGLTNILLIVTRYFGGIKLGIGLLGKTYYITSEQVLNSSDFITKELYKTVSFEAEFKYLNHLHRILSNYDAKITGSVYGNKVNLEALIKVSVFEKVKFALNDQLKGDIIITDSSQFFYK